MIFILFVPLAYPLLYSYIYTNEVVREVPVAVVDECGNALSRELLRKIDATPDVDIVAYCNNMAEAQEFLKEQKNVWHNQNPGLILKRSVQWRADTPRCVLRYGKYALLQSDIAYGYKCVA